MNQAATWKPLYRAGAIAALLAALIFRRNIGAEVSLFTGTEAIPTNAADWFGLLHSNPFLGLSFLAAFDLLNYLLVGLVFLALAAALWPAGKSRAALALAGGLVGIAVSFATNISLSMTSLSQQYATAAGEAQRGALLSAGEALLAFNNPMSSFPSTGAYVTLLLVALAGLAFSSLLLRSNRATGVVGLLAAGCDLAYCLVFPLTPVAPVYLLLAAAGLFWMVWHLLAARVLFKHAKERG